MGLAHAVERFRDKTQIEEMVVVFLPLTGQDLAIRLGVKQRTEGASVPWCVLGTARDDGRNQLFWKWLHRRCFDVDCGCTVRITEQALSPANKREKAELLKDCR